ncbi:MAG TPA: SDR family oxidoreductase [Steroidobacteraceae bacterium]|jgi:2-keto-3-deoxy-L-fuconate dehydrogenase|nr:SDR family oxidoreductase [Steroidobacteraceae bacterium]
MGRLNGKTALITAAGQGIGRATAELFAAEGALVWATDVVSKSLEGIRGCRTLLLDVCSGDSVSSALRTIGPVSVLFNCAGYVASGTILDCAERDWARSFDLNVTSMYRTIRAWLPSMLEQRGGSIINMSSVVGAARGAPNRFVYGATKAAVVGLTKTLAADFVTRGVRCNAICPGTVDTPSLHERLEATGDHDAALAAFKARQPMGRLGTVEEIAMLALYLASDESSFTTGQCLMVDGGWSN